MKRTIPFLVLALLALAAVAGAEDVQKKEITLVKMGTAPLATELAESLKPPTGYGATDEVPIRVPDWLKSRDRTITEDPDPFGSPFLSQRTPAASISVPGYANSDNAALFGFQIAPPDTEGDVGKDFYVQWNNLGWIVYSKATGAQVAGPFPGNIFWSTFGGSVCQTDNAGDPIVLYDQLAKQWVFSQFTSPSNPSGHQCFAISQGSNPLGPYFLYDFLVSPGQFNDYPKISVWPDGYYMTTNEFTGSFVGVNITAFERSQMLVGGAASAVQVTLPFTGFAPVRFSLQPAHLEGNVPPPASLCNIITQSFDDETWGVGGPNGPDGYQFWQFCPDYANPPASTFTTGPFVVSPNFNAGLSSVPQPGGPGLDPLGQFTMYRFQARVFPSGVKGVINHTIDIGGGLNTVRWAQLDMPSLAGISIADTGTLNPGDGLHRWVGSVAQDKVGNIGVSYSRSGAASFPSVYFTGRETTDPAGTLQAESVCIDGTGSQLGTNRWGDYSTISVDPEDQCTFWLTNEYVETTGNFSWDTRICAFKFPSCVPYNHPNPSPGTAGVNNTFSVSGATPGQTTFFLWDLTPGSFAVPGCPGQAVDLASVNILGTAVANAAGNASINFFVPGGASGLTVLFQAVELTTCTVSGLNAYTFP